MSTACRPPVDLLSTAWPALPCPPNRGPALPLTSIINCGSSHVSAQRPQSSPPSIDGWCGCHHGGCHLPGHENPSSCVDLTNLLDSLNGVRGQHHEHNPGILSSVFIGRGRPCIKHTVLMIQTETVRPRANPRKGTFNCVAGKREQPYRRTQQTRHEPTNLIRGSVCRCRCRCRLSRFQHGITLLTYDRPSIRHVLVYSEVGLCSRERCVDHVHILCTRKCSFVQKASISELAGHPRQHR